MNSKRIYIKTPATVANLVCGFDILGLALSAPQDEMWMSLLPERKIIIKHDDNFVLPEEAENNVAGAVLLSIMEDLQENVGFEVVIKKSIKPGSGLGSSAASSVAAAAGANYLLANQFDEKKVIQYAMNGEKLATGVKHADNIAPCLLGGITLIRNIHPLDLIKLDYPPLFVAVIHPQIEVKTSDARAILRKHVLLKDAIKQWGNIAGLVAGFYTKNYQLISDSLVDIIIEPTRSILIPGLKQIKERVKQETSALGGGISGSGPSIFMLCKEKETAMHIERIMKEVYDELEVDYFTYISEVNDSGVTIKEV